MYAKFRCAPLRVKKALGIFGPLENWFKQQEEQLESKNHRLLLPSVTVCMTVLVYYPRDAMLARSLRQRRVCLSVTRRYCAKTVHFRHKVTIGR